MTVSRDGDQDSVRALDRMLQAADSATVALETWCDARGLAPAPVRLTVQAEIRDRRLPPAFVAEALRLRADQPVCYRRVSLLVGGQRLSQAENWYAACRLTPAMNRTLETTDIPFGHVVAPLGISRRTLDSRMSGLDKDPETPAETILSHTAVVMRGDGRPVSVVREYYDAFLLRSP